MTIPYHIGPKVGRGEKVTARAMRFEDTMAPPVPHDVEAVLAVCIPPQIQKATVHAVAVVVARLHAFRARPDERCQDKAVNQMATAAMVSAGQTDCWITVATQGGPEHSTTTQEARPGRVLELDVAVQGPDAAQV